jgi:putative nucleotidyltransferase with HDIG domain
VFDNFETMLIIVLVTAVAFTVLIAPNKLALLNFFYIPVLLAGYFLGKKRGILTGVMAVLLVGLYAVLDPQLFASDNVEIPAINVFLWGAFLIITAYVVGSIYEAKEASVRDLYQAYEGILEIVAKFIDTVDGYTQDHSVRVSELGAKIARQMQLTAPQVETVRVAGLLHDVGKIEINLEVLHKATALDQAEWEHMKTHTTKGSKLLEPMGGLLRDVLPIVELHHEYYDGSGYHGTVGGDIPLGARILAVADAYDSMISDRPYRTGRTPWEAKLEIEQHAGQQFDPSVVDAFLSVMRGEVQYA